MSNDLQYYAKGRQVRTRPISTKHEDGSTSVSIGFPVCVVEEYVENPEATAEWIAGALNGFQTRD